MTPHDRLAKNLKHLRSVQGWSQDQMAFAVGCARSSWSGYERGTAEPSIDLLYKIQERFRIGADVLITTDLWTLPDHKWRLMVALSTPRMHNMTNVHVSSGSTPARR